MTPEDQLYRRMQVKVLYSFDNSPTVFLSRSKNQYSVKVAQIPMQLATEEEALVTLGAFDLKNCVQQILKSSPEHFRLHDQDYAVYYKDITEQPDEPFVANGVMSSLLSSGKQHLVPGRVCQNLLASFLFGDKANSSSLTLEIRLKLNVIEKHPEEQQQRPNPEKMKLASQASPSYPQQSQPPVRRSRPAKQQMASSAAVKATRTKSLPIFYHPPNQHISNIINADKSNLPSRYDSKSIQERFSLAPFMLAKIIDKPARKRRRSNVPLTPTVQTPVDNGLQPMRAMKTRSMVSNVFPSHSMISSPIHEELMSEASDDTEYQENSRPIDEEDEDEEDYNSQNDASSSPFTPQQPPYKPGQQEKKHQSNSIIPNNDHSHFQSLPDTEDLDSKKTHTIPSTKLPHDHDLVCINRNCAANDSITWRYFETKFHPSYLNIQRAEKFDKSLYDGMFGPLCNACYLFLRNKGFMRPEAVVKKYLQQQKYKKELKLKEDATRDKSSPFSSAMMELNKFPTPTHAPSAINEFIKNQNNKGHAGVNLSKQPTPLANGRTPTDVSDYQDLNDFMNQLNSFGGPLTDIDLPQDLQSNSKKESTPPAMATKSNTRVINLYEDEDKENQPPTVEDDLHDFDQMIMKSFSLRSSPDHQDWSQFFGEPTPKDANTPGAGLLRTPLADTSNNSNTLRRPLPKLDGQKAAVVNMPSSPLLSSYDDLSNKSRDMLNKNSSPGTTAVRNDTTMSYVQGSKSSPHSEIGMIDEKQSLQGL